MEKITLADYLGCKENEVYNIAGILYKVDGNYVYYLNSKGEFIKDYNLFTLAIIKNYFEKYLIVRKKEYCKAFDEEDYKFLTLYKEYNTLFTSKYYNDETTDFKKIFTKHEIEELKEKLNIELYEYDIILLSEYEDK